MIFSSMELDFYFIFFWIFMKCPCITLDVGFILAHESKFVVNLRELTLVGILTRNLPLNKSIPNKNLIINKPLEVWNNPGFELDFYNGVFEHLSKLNNLIFNFQDCAPFTHETNIWLVRTLCWLFQSHSHVDHT